MALNYHEILAAGAIRASALTGATPTLLETAFTTRPLTAAQFQSTIFSFSAIKQSLVHIEEKLAHAIANTEGHPWRKFLGGVTNSLAHKAALPTISSTSKQIIGRWGSVYDATDGTRCTPKSADLIRRRVRNANSFYRSPVYHFHIDDGRIDHTRTNVVIDVCVYDRAVQMTAVDANTAILLPEVLEEAYVCGLVSLLVRDDEFTGQAALYRKYFDSTLDMIHSGLTSVPEKAAA